MYPEDTSYHIQKALLDETYEDFYATKEGSVYKGVLNVFIDMFKLPESFGNYYVEIYMNVIKHFSSIKDTLLINTMPIDTISPILKDYTWGSGTMLAIDIKTVGNNFYEPIIIRLRFENSDGILGAVAVYDKDYNRQYCFESENV